jgi:hypothetical protein
MGKTTRITMVIVLLCGNAIFAFAADPPSRILFNAEILTMDDNNQVVQALGHHWRPHPCSWFERRNQKARYGANGND